MIAVLLLSIGILLAGSVASLLLVARSGETRVGWLTAALVAMLLRQIANLWARWDTSFALDAAGFAELWGLAASGSALLVVVAMWRTIGERDRAESLHWNGMEVVRVMGELSARPNVSTDDKLAALLDLGCARFELEIGMVSRVHKRRYEVLAVRAPNTFPVARGAVFSLEETCCEATLKSERPTALQRVSESGLARPERVAFGYQSYLGAAIRAGDRLYGTLSFGSLKVRASRFTATEKDLVNLMAQWLGTEIERIEAAGAPAQRGRAAASSWKEVRVPRGVDLNAVLRRLDRKLRDLAPGRLDITLAPDLEPAHAPRVPLETLIRSLVQSAIDAMPDDGALRLETANLEIAGGEPGVFPAVAPARYVTLKVSASGPNVDADAFTRAFEANGQAAAGPDEPRGDRLPLASVYRILQHCGGDLSAEVEPGHGASFTVFLPRPGDAATRAGPAPDAAAEPPRPAVDAT